MKKELKFGEITSFAFENGFKNFFPILGCIILWILTIWIPYINVGTTIAMVTLPAALSRGKMISPLEIFDSSYRKYMGEFFLVNGLKNMIIFPALLFMIVPGIVMLISYMFSTMIVVDKGKGASEAIKLSLEATDGHKWTIFFWFLFYMVVIIGIPSVIVSYFLSPAFLLLLFPLSVVGLAGMGYIYGQLISDVSEKDLSFKEDNALDKKPKSDISFKTIIRNFYNPWPVLIFNLLFFFSLINNIFHTFHTSINGVLFFSMCLGTRCSFFESILLQTIRTITDPMVYFWPVFSFSDRSQYIVLVYFWVSFLFVFQIFQFKWSRKVLGVICLLPLIGTMILPFTADDEIPFINGWYPMILTAVIFIPIGIHFFRKKG